MGLLHRDTFAGWEPGADAIKGARTSLLRMDNLTLDEEGAISLRLGSKTLNPVNPNSAQTIQPIGGSGFDIHSLFTTMIDGSRYRVVGGTTPAGTTMVLHNQPDGVWRSFGSFGGTGDIRLESFQGQILAARGTTKWKHNGNTRRWGIPAPTVKPSVTVLAPRIINVSLFGPAETELWIAMQGTRDNTAGQDGGANSAVLVTPEASGRKGTIQRVFASPQNYDSFDGGAATGVGEDSIEFYARVSNPDQLEYIGVYFDCNPDSAAPLQDDYFYFEVVAGDAVEVGLSNRDALRDRPDVEEERRSRFEDRRRDRQSQDGADQTRTRRDTPSGASGGWSKFRVLRGQMNRIGSTPGTGWNTIKAVVFTFRYADDGNSPGTVAFDDLRILGGSDRTLTGKFRAHTVFARDFGNYIAKSGPSPQSDEIDCQNNAIRVTIPSSDMQGADFQVRQAGGEGWAYLGGGTMRSFYRFATKAATVPGALSIDCTISERDAIITDLRMESDNQEPPDDAIAIVTNHYNRCLVITAKQVWISRAGNPDSFSLAQALDLADPSEDIKWGVKSNRGVYIGTSKDIYRLSGSLSEFPDGTMDARLDPLGINGPPVNEFVVHEGDDVIYLSADGFRMLAGESSHSINWNLDLLVQGHTRHGISPPILGITAAFRRFRGGLFNNRLYVLFMEGDVFDSSSIVYIADFRTKRWRRAEYIWTMMSLHREPDGTLIAGTDNGRLVQLEVPIAGDLDGGTTYHPIPINLWTVSDDDGTPLQKKEAFDWRAEMNTGGRNATVALYFDDALGPSMVVAPLTYGTLHQTLAENPSTPAEFKRVQHRINGSFLEFKLGSFSIAYRDRPIPMLYWDSAHLDFGAQDLVWFRELAVKARCARSLAVRVFFDGVLRHSTQIAVTAGVESIYAIDVPRGLKGRLPLIVIEPDVSGSGGAQPGATSHADAFELYWLRAKWHGTGGVTSKTFRIVDGKGGM